MAIMLELRIAIFYPHSSGVQKTCGAAVTAANNCRNVLDLFRVIETCAEGSIAV